MRRYLALRGATGDHGVSMIGLLAVVVILGVLAVVALSQSTPPSTSGSSGGTNTTTAPQSVASGAQLAAVAACQADFALVKVALQDYRAVNGSPPASGTAWAIRSALGGPYLQSWPSVASYFTIRWDGSALSVIPAKGVASHGSYGTKSPATGCFAG